MRTTRSGLWLGFGVAALLSACGGPSTVYVGVSGPGPWVGYPGAYGGGYGRPIGYPPRYWDDDAQEDDAHEDGEAQAGAVEVEADLHGDEADRAEPTG